MHPFAFLLIMVAAGAAVVHGGDPASNTPAVQFWEQALPGTPMPQAIADLVQEGIDHSPHVEHYSALPSISACILTNTICDARTVAETGLFFHQSQLHPGSVMTVSFPPAQSEPAILPRDVADKVPFANLLDVLAAFNIPAGSAEAAQVRDTLSRCEAPPLAGEVKTCTTSLETTVSSAVDMLGTNTGVWVGSSVIPRGGLPRQPYVVKGVTRVVGDSYISCHKVPFPYAVYHCHGTKQPGYIAHVVSLKGLHGGQEAAMLAYCHLDTSDWNPAHPAFEILNTHPGGTPVCHFTPYGSLGFLKKTEGA
ncbi:unnamed protein product [Urochloa decumbens]|uniref:BURP domain-containing protein n=1 Tax=Urochloa decumbens TaxID=240449 RepID=A0ABC8VWM3_9POAL